jgi:elongation factor P
MKTAFYARTGTVLKISNELFIVLKHEAHRGGRGATNVKMRMKNLMTGSVVDRVFDGEEKLEDVTLQRSKFEFLYESTGTYAFMDQSTYEQIELSEDDIGDAKNFLTEGLAVDVQQYEGKFVGIVLPQHVTLKVVECEPGVKGNTADGKVTKDATLETGYTLKVPGFVESGESIVVNTETGDYSERAK